MSHFFTTTTNANIPLIVLDQRCISMACKRSKAISDDSRGYSGLSRMKEREVMDRYLKNLLIDVLWETKIKPMMTIRAQKLIEKEFEELNIDDELDIPKRFGNNGDRFEIRSADHLLMKKGVIP